MAIRTIGNKFHKKLPQQRAEAVHALLWGLPTYWEPWQNAVHCEIFYDCPF